LKVVWATGPEGQRIFHAWYDTKLELNCRFDFASDGKKRCLPVAALGTGSAFTDSQCSAPAAQTFGTLETPYYKILNPSAYPPRTIVGKLGAKLPADALFTRRNFRRTAKSGVYNYQRLACEPRPELYGGTVFAPRTA
jgi:hypothetical protein